ncbi:hypothetical protein BGX38DRAFT_456904 [Terfezia claveryi]|nr:hypothetical protein BGX38DRAFT_456904 [Terfezia claveryi]
MSSAGSLFHSHIFFTAQAKSRLEKKVCTRTTAYSPPPSFNFFIHLFRSSISSQFPHLRPISSPAGRPMPHAYLFPHVFHMSSTCRACRINCIVQFCTPGLEISLPRPAVDIVEPCLPFPPNHSTSSCSSYFFFCLGIVVITRQSEIGKARE